MTELYEYTVKPEHMCAGLMMWHKETGKTRFTGIKRYSNHYNTEYYTTDDITFTFPEHAECIVKIGDSDVNKD